jgi:hypothetical protein
MLPMTGQATLASGELASNVTAKKFFLAGSILLPLVIRQFF